MSPDRQLGLSAGVAHHLQVFIKINKYHILPIFWDGKKYERTTLLKDQRPLEIIGLDADKRLVTLHTLVVIKRK